MADKRESALMAVAIVQDEGDTSSDDDEIIQEIFAFSHNVTESVDLVRGRKRKRGEEGDISASTHAESIPAGIEDDYSFRLHFRMERSTFQTILEGLGARLEAVQVPLEKQLLSSLWLLATQDSYRCAGQKFGISTGTLHWFFLRICKALTQMAGDYIRFPQPHDFKKTADSFLKLAGFPGVVGCVDGSYIPIRSPTQSRTSYVCRKGFPALHLQACCLADLQFSSVTVGNPGSIHDAKAYTTSGLHASLLEHPLPSEYQLLGDLSYPLQMGLLTPYRDNGHLTAAQINFNTKHSGTRVVIDKAFGRLKGMFRRLTYLDMTLIQEMSDVVIAACVLHNIILQKQGDQGEIVSDYPSDVCSDEVDNDEDATDTDDSAEAKRSRLATALLS